MATEDVQSNVESDGPDTPVSDPEAIDPGEQTTGTGLDSNVAGALSYVFGALSGIAMYVLEPDDAFVRFHASQSIVLSVGLFVLAVVTTIFSTVLSALAFGGSGTGLVFGLVSLLISLAWLLVTLAAFGLWLFMMYQAYQGNTTRIPVVAGIADRIA